MERVANMATRWIGKAAWLTMSRVMLCENRCNRELNRECGLSLTVLRHIKQEYPGVALTSFKVSQLWFPFTRQEKGAS